MGADTSCAMPRGCLRSAGALFVCRATLAELSRALDSSAGLFALENLIDAAAMQADRLADIGQRKTFLSGRLKGHTSLLTRFVEVALGALVSGLGGADSFLRILLAIDWHHLNLLAGPLPARLPSVHGSSHQSHRR